MSIRHLDSLLHPGSIAVFGATADPASLGIHLMHNLLSGGFAGPILPVNPDAAAVAGVLSYPDVAALPLAPDLALICDADPAGLPKLITALGARGTRAAVLLGRDFTAAPGPDGARLMQATLLAARPYLLRLLGPASFGFLVPGIGLHASLSPVAARKGRLGFVSHSAALCTVVLDWATSNGIGFSHAISLGASADVDVGDILDYLAADPDTRAIVLYLDTITHSRKFMSAARAIARSKPVVAVRPHGGIAPPHGWPGPDGTADDVYSAAFSRAGIVRVEGIEELFDAVETLSRTRRLPGERLAILSSDEGPEALALDALPHGAGMLAELAPATRAALATLGAGAGTSVSAGVGAGGIANPVILPPFAPPALYGAALKLLLADGGVDAVLALHVPSAWVSAEAAAATVIEAAKGVAKNVLTCWLGRDSVAPARRLLAAAGLPSYETPRAALRAFLHMVEYRRTQEMLMETPPEVPADFVPDPATAGRVIAAALSAGRTALSEPEASAVLAAYGMPMVETAFAATLEEAQRAAARLGYPVALKILSPDIPERRSVGGVALDVEKPRALARAAEAMQDRVKRLAPGARIEGFAVQKLSRRPQAQTLAIGAMLDPLFGPVIRFGRSLQGEGLDDDQALGLPPLNLSLAAALIQRTRIGRHLVQGPAAGEIDTGLLALTLVKLSQLVVDHPQLIAVEIDPLLADDSGIRVRGARIRIAPAEATGTRRLAIRPYPQQLEETFHLRSGRSVLFRPIRPEDEPAHLAFFHRLAPEDVRFRFFNLVRVLPHPEMARFTQIDYDRQMAFIATATGPEGRPETLGVVRTVTDPDNEQTEFAIAVRSDLKGQGLGRALMEKMIGYCRGRGTHMMIGQVLRDNQAMRHLSESLGFHPHLLAGEDAVEMRLELIASPAPSDRNRL